MESPFDHVVTVTLNPALDCIFEVPGFKIGAHQQGRVTHFTPSGKGVNVARTLALLGVSPTVTGFVGNTEQPLYEHAMQSIGASYAMVGVHGQTRENITLVDPVGLTETHIRDTGFDVKACDKQALEDKLTQLAGDRVLIVFSGSLPPGFSPSDLRHLVDVCAKQGSLVAIDSGGETLRAFDDCRLWAMKPNREEFEGLTGKSLDDDDDLIAEGVSVAGHVDELIVSCGKAGGYLFIDGQVYRGRIVGGLMKVVSSVGCGDTLLGGYITGRLQGKSPLEAYGLAVAVATAATATAVPGEFQQDLVDGFLSRKRIERIERIEQ